jgi:DNA-binding MarR family transcriptional regulator
VLRPAHCADEVLETIPAVMDAMRGAMRQHVGEQLSVPQFRCLNWIARRPGSCVSDVAAFLGVTLPTASAMVERLVRSGALAPTTATQDRRRTELQLTDVGLAQLSDIRRAARSEFTRKLAVCTQHELQALQAGMTVLRQVFATA